VPNGAALTPRLLEAAFARPDSGGMRRGYAFLMGTATFVTFAGDSAQARRPPRDHRHYAPGIANWYWHALT